MWKVLVQGKHSSLLFGFVKPVRTLKSKASGDIIQHDSKDNFFRNGCSITRGILDPAYSKMNENSKLIVVEGNTAVGKNLFAKRAADFFGMDCYRGVTEDDIYVMNEYDPPVDLREYNSLLPDFAKYYTLPMFWNDPDPIRNGKPLFLNYHYYMWRHWNYAKAHCSLLNTGRGAVVVGSPYSSIGYVEASKECDLMSANAAEWFAFVQAQTLGLFWKPHLIIYIKASPSYIRKKLKERNNPWEMNARNMTDKFFAVWERSMEEQYFAKIRPYSEIVVLDTSVVDIDDPDEVAVFCQQLTKVDLTGTMFYSFDTKYMEWNMGISGNLSVLDYRRQFSNSFVMFNRQFSKHVMPRGMTEGYYSPEALEYWDDLRSKDPRLKFSPDYDPRRQGLLRVMFAPHVRQNYEKSGPREFLRL